MRFFGFWMAWFRQRNSSLLWNFSLKFHVHVICGCRQKPNDCQLCRFQNGCLMILNNVQLQSTHCPLPPSPMGRGGILVDHWSIISSSTWWCHDMQMLSTLLDFYQEKGLPINWMGLKWCCSLFCWYIIDIAIQKVKYYSVRTIRLLHVRIPKYSVVPLWCSTVCHDITQCNHSSRIEIRLGTHKRHPIPRPHGCDMGCLLWEFWRKMTTF